MVKQQVKYVFVTGGVVSSLGKGIAVMVGSPAPESIAGMPQPTRVRRTNVVRMLTNSTTPCFMLRFPLKNHCLATKGT